MVHSVTEWVASIPDQVSPREGLALVDVALGDAKEATDAILAEYTGGTLPPPPWPRPPNLVTAIKRMEGGRLMLTQAIEMGHGDDKSAKDSIRVLPLLDGGRVLYREIENMRREHKAGIINPANLPRLAARGLASFLPTGLGGFAALALVIYIAGELNE